MDRQDSWSLVHSSNGPPSINKNDHLEAVPCVFFGTHLSAQWLDSERVSAAFGLKNKISVPCPLFFLRGNRVMKEMTMSVCREMVGNLSELWLEEEIVGW